MEIQNTHHTPQTRGKLFENTSPIIMGILNATPDSFYTGSRVAGLDKALIMAESMIHDGADVLDLGAYSSRPGAQHIEQQMELDRLIPVVEKISKSFPSIPLSVDTFRSTVAQYAVEAGASIVNDISAGEDDPKMLQTVAQLGVAYIAMHKKGSPQTMQVNPEYQDVLEEVLNYGKLRIKEAKAKGINDVLFDPGFGFGKTSAHNFHLLKHFDAFNSLGVPLMAGISRKGMIWKNLQLSPDEALNGSSVLHAWLLDRGASVLRVHDVKEACEAKQLFELMQNA